ncbi:unnamed protein product, partial [Gongylonema pulchrum]|uniref:Peptidase A1 domain-containing protein n=1 Tax=Gongylonema pulchrum TaxID=637853 RepID=A0A183EJ43_9BILA
MWSINFHDLFEVGASRFALQNYNNFRKWQNEEISYGAFVFGDVVKTEITDVLFSPFVDLEFCLDTARLIENSLPS